MLLVWFEAGCLGVNGRNILLSDKFAIAIQFFKERTFASKADTRRRSELVTSLLFAARI